MGHCKKCKDKKHHCKLSKCKATFLEICAKLGNIKKINTDLIILQGENVDTKFENLNQVERGEFEVMDPHFLPGNETPSVEFFELGFPVTKIENQEYLASNELITNVVINNKPPPFIESVLFIAVVLYSPAGEDATFVYNIKTNTFDKLVGPVIPTAYLFFIDERIAPTGRTVNFAETVKFTNREMQDFIAKQQELGTPIPGGANTVLFIIGLTIELSGDELLPTVSKDLTVTYSKPKL